MKRHHTAPPETRTVAGVKLRRMLGVWFGNVNGKRFAIRPGEVRGRGLAGKVQTFAVFALPATMHAEPVATGVDLDAAVLEAVRLWKHVAV